MRKYLGIFAAIMCITFFSNSVTSMECTPGDIQIERGIGNTIVTAETEIEKKYMEAICYFEAGSYEDASKILSELVVSTGRSREVLKMLGIVQYKKSNYKSAISYLLESADANTPDPEIVLYVGKSYKGLGLFGRAENVFRMAAEMTPSVNAAEATSIISPIGEEIYFELGRLYIEWRIQSRSA